MDIVNLNFEESLFIHVNSKKVELLAFKTLEPGNIKLGVNAPPSISIDREEIYHKKKQNGGV